MELLSILMVVVPIGIIYLALARYDHGNGETPTDSEPRVTPARLTLMAMTVAVGIALVAYRWIAFKRLEQSAALFVGIPMLLALVVIFFTSPRSVTGVIMKAITIALLLSAVFLWEGVLCILMSAPLLYAIGGIIGLAFDLTKRSRNQSIVSCFVVLALVPLSVEDLTPATTLPRREVVSVTRDVAVPSDAVADAVLAAPRFERRLPPYLRAGFPRPVATTISSERDSRRWIIRMRGGEMRINGMEPRAGDLVLDTVEERPGRIRWQATSDDSHMTHFLYWRAASVEWERIDGDRTRVTWTLAYDRGLAPSWYFGPWERYAARLAADYLIDAVATP